MEKVEAHAPKVITPVDLDVDNKNDNGYNKNNNKINNNNNFKQPKTTTPRTRSLGRHQQQQ